MVIRLGVASMGVAFIAHLSSPLIAMVGFLTLVGVPVSWRAWVAHTEVNHDILPPENE